ncbi:Hypothetical predicted protein [Mytilus galloprovincialis]|uniref:Uncharacterized protein n=1 Tax=Mytilus galloprovincialis TaxID=29158 RepID=A0A8B6FKF4_MYTGA|nr:Hypothetical predicted protein [Mytilus galloprovincialis]
MDSELTYNINDDDAQNVTQRNGKHFKSDIINHWEDIDVEQVKVVVYQNGLEHAFLSFDGSRTNKTNWFSQERLMNSSYSDLMTEDTQQRGYYFSIDGYAPLHRRFYVNKLWDGCPNDSGWLLVSEGKSGFCSFEPENRLLILYSSKSTFMNGVEIKTSTCQSLASQADICSTPVQLAFNMFCYTLCNNSKAETNLQEKIQKLEKELSVKKKDTSNYKRSLTSAPDDRFSSKAMGLVGALCIAIVVGFIISLDCVSICKKLS